LKEDVLEVDIETQIKALAELLIERRCLVNAQRKFLKPPPGQKRLIKFPKKVLPVEGAKARQFNEDGFMCWTYDRPTPTWVYVVSALCAIGVVLLCLFPVAPTWVKIAVMYMSTVLLAAIVGFLVVRGIIALITYILMGSTVWVLPNSLDDNLPWRECFKPLVSVERPELNTRGDKAKHYAMRAVVMVGVGILTYILYLQTPGQDVLKKNVGRYRDDLFDYFNVYNNRDMLGDGSKNGSAEEDRPPKEDPFADFGDLDDLDDLDLDAEVRVDGDVHDVDTEL
jgi:translocation protein SEC62